MNKNTHRLVFNKSRGCVVAVAETASSRSKSSCGASCSSKRRSSSSKYAKAAIFSRFRVSNQPLAQWIPAQAAPIFIVDNGNININAGQAYKQVGSDIIAPAGDINISAKKVDIVEARETSQTTTEQKFKQTALTLSVSSPVIAAIQQGQGMAQAASQTSSGRMQALAAASTALNVFNNAGDITKSAQALASGNPAAAARITLSLGTSKSQSNSSSQSDTARGSTVGAGNNVNITATALRQAQDAPSTSSGRTDEGNILIQGSDVKAANNTTLAADNQVNLLAAKNESSQTSTNSSSSGSLSISWGAGGWGAGASASKGKGKSDGEDTIFTNTNVTAGNTATIKSGGDTNLKGAVVEANTIKADVGGSLKIESLQDKSTYSSEQKNVSGSVSVGGGGNGASVSASKSNVDSSFQSVGQQSGLKAGDGGFQVAVNNNTTLTGTVIASTQSAVENNKNTFTTGGALSITDIQNTASFSGKAVGGTVGVGSQLGSSGAGVGSKSGNASSTSSAGISGIAGNTAVRTGDAETGLRPIFDADKVQKDINAQVQIMTAFTQQAGKAVGDYAGKQLLEATAKKEQAKNETDPDKRTALLKEAQNIEGTWGEGKPGRVGLHVIVGALTGNLAGALGAGASASAAPLINQLQDGIASSLQSAGLGKDAAKGIASGIAGLTAAGVGAAVGGTQGAATAFTVDTNNRQLHREEKSALTKSASDFAKKMRLQGYELTDEKALAILTEQADNRVDETQARRLDTATMDDALKSHAQRYLNGVSNTLGSYDDGRGNQIRYFTNTTSSGDRRYEDYKNSSINAMPNTPPIDYVSIQGGGFGVGGNVSVNVLNQEVFVGGGKSTFSSVPGFSIVGGRMIDGSADTDKRSVEVTDMLRGGSVQGAVCFGGLCAGVNQSIGPIGSNPPRAIEIGIGTPGVGGGVGASVQAPTTGVKK